jgi:serine protease Do
MKTTVRLMLVMLVAVAAPMLSSAQQKEPLRDAKEKSQAWLGVTLRDVTQRLARDEGLPAKSGALVEDVMEESPAEAAGIAEGDIIVGLNGKEIADAEAVVEAVGDLAPGTKADLTLMRKSGKTSIQVTLGKRPGRRHAMSFTIPRIPPIPRIRVFTEQDMLGMSLSRLTKQLADYFEAPKGKGVLVQEVEEEGPAAKAGFKAGDVIVSVDGNTAKDPGDVAEAVESSDHRDKVPIDVIRKGKPVTLQLDASTIGRHERSRNRFYWNGDESWNDSGRKRLHLELQRMGEELRHMSRELSVNLRDLGKTIRMELGAE